jgi:type I restriction enzyme, S subunit
MSIELKTQNVSLDEQANAAGSRYHVYLPKLPASWSYQRFDDILDVQGGSQPPKSTFVYEPTPGYVQLLQIRDFGERGVPTYVREDSVTKRCTEDDILIARYGASLGRIVTGQTGAYNVALAKVIFDKNKFYNRYLFYVLKTPFFQTPIHMISRSAQNGFNKGDLSDILLPVAPFAEQHRIVAEIEQQFTRLDAGVAALRRTQANLKRYRAAVLKAACEGRLVPTATKTWKEGTLRDVLVGIEAGKSFRCEERPPTKSEIGVVKVSSVTWGTYDELESKTCQDVDRVEVRYLVKPGDFLFSRANTIQLIGKCVIAQQVTVRVMLSDKILRFHFSTAVIPSWILYWLRSDFGRHEIERLSTGNQESMRNIGQERIRQIVVRLPSLDEQTRIIAEVERRLSVVEELETVMNANLQRATRLRKSVLQKAFSGESTTKDNQR